MPHPNSSRPPLSHRRTNPARFLPAVFLVLLALAACSTTDDELDLEVQSPLKNLSILASAQPDRSNAFTLDGTAASGALYVFVPDHRHLHEVRFFINDPERRGPAARVDSSAPFDLIGGTPAAAEAWTPTTFPSTVTVELRGRSGAPFVHHATVLAPARELPKPVEPEPAPHPHPGDEGPVSDALRWSDPATWGGSTPVAGQAVVVPHGVTILLDVDPPSLGDLRVDGTLEFARRDTQLSARSIMVHGRLQIGTPEQPFEQRAIITLTGTASDPSVMGMGQAVLAAHDGGRLHLHGAVRGPTWTRLARTAPAGATSIVLEHDVTWRAGDEIVIASTDYAFEQTERVTIRRVEGRTVTFVEPLKFVHWGDVQYFDGRRVDTRAEVGLLTRNIVVRGSDASETTGFGGHVMIMDGSVGQIEGVEFFRMGQRGVMSRYPIHFHLVKDASESYVRANTIHRSFSRCITVHGTNRLRVTENVAYDAVGHCIFLEDGSEVDNHFERNLVLVTRRPEAAHALLPSDHSHLGPASYWITNPQNTFIDNVAGGSRGTGFWIALPRHPTGLTATTSMWPRRTPLGEFRGNVAHSNSADGLHLDNGPRPDGTTESAGLVARQNPADPNSPVVESAFVDFTAFKNRHRGIWFRGGHHVIRNAVFADNLIAVTLANHHSSVVDSVIVGDTANKGTPGQWERAGHDGRSLPIPWDQWANEPLRGFEFYDGPIHVADSHFAGFTDNSVRRGMALTHLHFTDWEVHVRNSARNVTFAPGTNRVYHAPRPVPTNPAHGEDGWRSATFRDVDGSVTGTAGSAVVVNNPFLLTNRCSFRSDWNSYVCNERYGALTLENMDSARQAIGPITVARGSTQHVLLGMPDGAPNRRFRTNLLIGQTYDLTFSGAVPSHLQIRFSEANTGDWIQVSIPYAGRTAHVYGGWWIDPASALRPVSSLAALQQSTTDAFFHDGQRLHLKYVLRSGRDWAALDICSRELCR